MQVRACCEKSLNEETSKVFTMLMQKHVKNHAPFTDKLNNIIGYDLEQNQAI